MRLHPTLLFVLLSGHAVAQGKGLAIVPKSDPMVRAAAEDIQAVLAQLPKTAAGKLLAEPEVAAAFDTGVGRWRVLARRREAVVQAAMALDLGSADAIATRIWSQLDVRDLVRAEVANVRSEEHSNMPFTLAQFACTPKAEGRLTRVFEEHARSLAACKALVAVPEVKLDGHPAYTFDPAPDQPDEERMVMTPGSIWLLHLPGVFAFGDGKPEQSAKVAETKARPAGVALMVDFKAFLGMFAGFGGGVPSEFAAIGFDTLERLQARASFAGERVLGEYEVHLGGKPGGIIGSLLTGKAALPAQALPEGALLQLRCAVDLAMLVESVGKLAMNEMPVPEEMQKDLGKAFDGSLALGVCAPAPGGVIPRMFLSLRLADAAAFDRLLALLPEGLPKKEVTYEGQACTVISPPGAPAALQPTFCKRDGMLHIAESGLSMRAFLKAQKEGVTAMDVGSAPVPPGEGEPLASLDLRWDEAAMYRAFHEVWLPLFALSGGDPTAHPLLKRDDMPEPAVVQKFTGKGRGVLRKTAQGYVLQNLSPLGGPELAGLAMTWGPILSGYFHHDWTVELLEGEIARKKLEIVWPALEAYKKDKGAFPAKLGDLFANSKLAADALLLPGDEGEAVELPAGDARKIRSSFRYFPVPVKLEQEEGKVMLIEIAARRYRRAMLGEDGSMPNVWGEDSTKPVDQFGK